MIPQSNISLLSNRLFKEHGGKRIPEAVLERDYCIAWFLAGLSRSTLKEFLVFKGGTALRRCYFAEYRFSEDLDFSLMKQISFDDLLRALNSIYETVKKASNIDIQFSRRDSKSHQNCYTFYLQYNGPLPHTSSTKEIKVDITINEKIYYPPNELPIIKTYSEFFDLPDNNKIYVYSLPEIATEKTIALLDRGRSEPRDLYDLWYLIELNKALSMSDCLDALQSKLAHRGKLLNQVREEFKNKEYRLNKTWSSRLSAQMSILPEFTQVYRDVKRAFRQTGIIS